LAARPGYSRSGALFKDRMAAHLSPRNDGSADA
jgi:hypothetical protein